MLALSVEFLHGTFRGDPDGTANTGRLASAEWPPSPARLFAALVAADGTRQDCRVTGGSELAWFEQLPPPTIYAQGKPHHGILQPRYVVRHKGTAAKKTHQEYVGREAALVRPGVRVSMRDPRVLYVWRTNAPRQKLEALRRRAARIAYIGASDSPARVRVRTQLSPQILLNDVFAPDPSGDTMVSVPRIGDLAILDRMYDEWRVSGPAVSRHQFPALRHAIPYRSPRQWQFVDRGEVVAWLRLDRYISGRRITALTGLFKAAVLSQHQRIHGEPSPLLHGHGFTGTGYEIARYLALPDAGFDRSKGRIHGIALWMPPNSGMAERRMARDAAYSIKSLRGHGINVSVSPREDEHTPPIATQPRRWQRSSSRWATVFPAIHERRRTLDLDEVTRWCRHAGVPEPVGFRASRVPLVRGAIDLSPAEVNRGGRVGLPYSHLELKFPLPVPGPIVIGSGRQRGFGLCVPLDSSPVARID